MDDSLLSVGIDVGTSTTQLVVSRLTVENRANAYCIPDLEISRREILYESPIHFTPLRSETELDAEKLHAIVEKEYRAAGLSPKDVSTGAIIITGETARKENARQVLTALRGFAGEFVVATAGPDLESVLAAKGAGAVAYSQKSGKRLLHTDIGGGTSNMALIEDGVITATGCLNVGGRLIRQEQGIITYVSPVLRGLCCLQPGDRAAPKALEAVADTLVHALEVGSGLCPGTIPPELVTSRPITLPPGEVTFSFSGGVGALLGTAVSGPSAFGDIGPILAERLKKSALCRNGFYLGEQTIRATVIGAGCYSTQLSGSTVYARCVTFPLKSLPVGVLSEKEQDGMDRSLEHALDRLRQQWPNEPIALYLPGIKSPSFKAVSELADRLALALPQLPQPYVIISGTDMAKALGQALATRLPGALLCLDGLRLQAESFLDVGAPVSGGAAYPVVKKTLVFEH